MSKKLEIMHLPIGVLKPMEENPNVQSDKTFNALVDSIRADGMFDPIDVAPRGDGLYDIIGGTHRYYACELLGHEEIPCIVHDGFDEDKRKMMLVRLNVLRGKISSDKFIELYNNLSDKYEEEVLKEMMGFAEEEAFKNLYKDIRDSLPDEVKSLVDEKKEEIKTIDDMAVILNDLFRKYGDTVDNSFMVFTFGGKDHIWIDMTPELNRKVNTLKRLAIDSDLSLSELMNENLRNPKLPDSIGEFSLENI